MKKTQPRAESNRSTKPLAMHDGPRSCQGASRCEGIEAPAARGGWTHGSWFTSISGFVHGKIWKHDK